MYTIRIPVGCEGGADQTKFSEFCEHFSCRLQKKKRGDVYWTIESEDCTNFFWLGANLNYREKTNLTITIASKILG